MPSQFLLELPREEMELLAPTADAVRGQREAVNADAPTRKVERMTSELINASLDYYRDIRDATSEAIFLQTYGNLYNFYLADRAKAPLEQGLVQRRQDLPVVKEALAAMAKGGYEEALARVSVLLSDRGQPIPLAQVELRSEVRDDYADLLPDLPEDEWRRIRGTQEIMVEYDTERAISTLPMLLADAGDRERLLTLMENMLRDERIKQLYASNAEQTSMYSRIRSVLGAEPDQEPKLKVVS